MTTHSIHVALARSYMMFFIFSSIGVFLDSVIGVSVHIPLARFVAVCCFAIGSLCIIWAQYTSRYHNAATDEKRALYVSHGPYRYLRNPTQLGIVFLVLGYTAISGSLVFFFVTVVGYILSNIFFRHYEKSLLATYPEEYAHYQKEVPKVF